jgi:cell division protein FtsL
MRVGQILHRERDPRTRRSMAWSLAAAAVLVAATLGMVGVKVWQVRLSYQLDTLRDRRQSLGELNHQLRVELATLRSPARIEVHARALGLTAPGRDQVRLAREFVADGRGLASLQVAETRPAGGVGMR